MGEKLHDFKAHDEIILILGSSTAAHVNILSTRTLVYIYAFTIINDTTVDSGRSDLVIFPKKVWFAH